jgi:hypothetical protein
MLLHHVSSGKQLLEGTLVQRGLRSRACGSEGQGRILRLNIVKQSHQESLKLVAPTNGILNPLNQTFTYDGFGNIMKNATIGTGTLQISTDRLLNHEIAREPIHRFNEHCLDPVAVQHASPN